MKTTEQAIRYAPAVVAGDPIPLKPGFYLGFCIGCRTPLEFQCVDSKGKPDPIRAKYLAMRSIHAECHKCTYGVNKLRITIADLRVDGAMNRDTDDGANITEAF